MRKGAQTLVFEMCIRDRFVTGLPGIIIQLVLLPSLVVALTKARLLRVR